MSEERLTGFSVPFTKRASEADERLVGEDISVSGGDTRRERERGGGGITVTASACGVVPVIYRTAGLPCLLLSPMETSGSLPCARLEERDRDIERDRNRGRERWEGGREREREEGEREKGGVGGDGRTDGENDAQMER